jgi:hypothetical protein
MAFVLQPGQAASLTIANVQPGQMLQYLRFDAYPTQSLPGFPVPMLASSLPNQFSNTGSTAGAFDIDAYEYGIPPLTPLDWRKIIVAPQVVPGVPGGPALQVFIYTWGSLKWHLVVALL